MPTTSRREAPLLFAGDIFFLTLSLYATLFIRTGAIPSQAEFISHLVPFIFLFVISTGVFHIAGLYDKHTLLFKSRLSETIFFAQLANIVVAALFFFLIPYFGIQPKTNLFLYLLLSTALVSFWRIYIFPLLTSVTPLPAILVGVGTEVDDAYNEVNGNTRYSIRFVSHVKVPDALGGHKLEIFKELLNKRDAVAVVPFSFLEELAKHPEWDSPVLSGVRFVDFSRLFEELFDRVSITHLDYRRLLEESYRTETLLYAYAKRAVDVVISALALVVLSPLLLIVALVLSLDGKPPLIFQTRIGKGGREIQIIKFRTMLFDDGGDPEKQMENKVTRFGKFLRKAQIDEMPQFWNVIRGDLSLIGPRPEIPALTREYERFIPFYHARHMIQPGISGWAQIKHASPPKWKLDVEATRHKLSYDLYYLKHRSIMIDLSIVLRTVKIFLRRAGV